MDDHLNPEILGNFDNNCENMEVRKPIPQGVLKGVENGNLQFMNMQDREQEFIDHTLLAPEYISHTISSSFIIDLIDQQGQPPPDCPINSLNPNDSFSSDAQLHTILQFVNRQGQIRTQTNISAESSSDHLTDNHIIHTDKEIFESDLLALHGNLLNEQNFKIFCGQQSISTQEALSQDLNVSSLPSLPVQNAPLTPNRWHKKERYEEPLEQIPDLMGPLGAKKILPHKKRISKKLKTMENSEFLYQLSEENPARSDRQVVSNGSQFECEICGAVSESQVQFFSHLKGHYEPNAVDDSKCTNETIDASSIAVTGDTSVIEKAQSSQTAVVETHQVFNEVELNFDSFNEVVQNEPLTPNRWLKKERYQEPLEQIPGLMGPLGAKNVPQTEPDHADMKILNSNVIAKCMEYVVQQDTTQSCSVHDEVEFSDTEDMLEGLRGVVDKVSVDDTSDDLDMPPPSVSKEPWFANSAFSGLNFKEEPISNESFERVSDLIPMQPEQNKENDEEKPCEIPHPSEEVTDDFTGDHHVDLSSDDLNESQIPDSNDFPEKRKRGRPKGSKKKKNAGKSEAKAEDDDSSVEMESSKRRRYICSKCNREFNSCNALKYHDLSHTGERPHQCDVCGKSFFAQSALKSHLRVHTGDKPYECDKCHRKFRQWSDLKYHIVSIHSDEKNYQCEFCGKSFSRKYSLVIHRRIHTSERNYKCEFCPKSFRASSYLQNHRKIHTGEKPYECKICCKKFRVSGDLRRHYRTHERNGKTSNESKAPSNCAPSPTKPSTELDAKTDMLIKMEYEKDNKEEMLFLDKVATKIDNLFKTEETFANASIENNDLTFVT